MAFKHYLEEEDDKPYFTTNSLGYYYDKMEGFAEKVEQAAKTLNVTKEEVEKNITAYIEQNKNELDQRLAQWDGKLETFDSSVETLLAEWVDDGTLTHVIDSTLIDQKIAPVTAQLADKATKKELNELGQLRVEGVYDTLSILQSERPSGASGLFLVIADGYNYRWTGSAWVKTVKFQSSYVSTGTNLINLIANGNFVDVSGWTPVNGTLTTVNNEATFSVTALAASTRMRKLDTTAIAGHKYYVRGDIKPKYGTTSYIAFGGHAGDTSKTTIPNVYNEISGIVTAINTSDFNFYHNTIEQYVVGDTIGFKNMFVIDLTAAYGAGNEPTKAQIEEVLNAFPSRWFNGSIEVTPPMNIDELIEEVNTKVSKEEFNEAISESKSNKTILKVSDYPNLRVALETATANASKENPYEVQIGEGEVNLLSLYTQAEIENTGFQGVVISNYVTLVGTGKKDKTILRMEIPNTWLNATILRVAPIAYMGDGGMENLTVIGRNCRYTVHDDYGYPDTKKYIKNCTFIKLAGLGNSQAWGEGSFSGMEFYFEDCEFITEYGHASYSTHNNVDFVKPSYHSFKNCKFINNGGYFGIRFITLRSGVMDKVDMEGCYIDGLIKCEEHEAGNGCLFDIHMHSCSEVPVLIDATNGSQPVYTVIEETKKVFNAETTTITKGTPVMFNNDGSVILRLGSNPVSLILGIALQDIPASGKGVIKTGGYLPVTDTGLTLTKGDKVGVVAGALAKVTTGDYIGVVTRNGFIKLKF